MSMVNQVRLGNVYSNCCAEGVCLEVAACFALRILAGVLVAAAAGLWILPGSTFAADLIVIKLALSAILAGGSVCLLEAVRVLNGTAHTGS